MRVLGVAGALLLDVGELAVEVAHEVVRDLALEAQDEEVVDEWDRLIDAFNAGTGLAPGAG